MSLRAEIKALRRLTEEATADKLPDDPWRYFAKTDKHGNKAELVPVAKLKTIRARSSGIENAAGHMANAYNGKGKRRDPIEVKRNDDGTYTVLDGNSTTAIAMKHNWKMMPVVFKEGLELADTVWRFAEELLGEDFKPGTIRNWKTGSMIKLGDGTWAPYQGAAHAAAAVPVKVKPEATAKIMGHLGAIADLQAAGKLPKDKTPAEHKAIAQEFVARHAKTLPEALERVQAVVVGDGTAVMGRVKEVESAIGKLVRKPKYKTVAGLKDGTGMRVVCNSTEDVLASVKALKERFENSAEDEEDYISKPKEGYRSYHLVVKDDDGEWKEIQIRTPNQDTWANWCHDVYKPQTTEQELAVDASKNEILDYGSKMSDYYFDKDSGRQPKDPPDCPPVVQKVFGCLPTT